MILKTYYDAIVNYTREQQINEVTKYCNSEIKREIIDC